MSLCLLMPSVLCIGGFGELGELRLPTAFCALKLWKLAMLGITSSETLA